MPVAGQLCTALAGCSRPALLGRWVCAEHAEALERRAAKHRARAEGHGAADAA